MRRGVNKQTPVLLRRQEPVSLRLGKGTADKTGASIASPDRRDKTSHRRSVPACTGARTFALDLDAAKDLDHLRLPVPQGYRWQKNGSRSPNEFGFRLPLHLIGDTVLLRLQYPLFRCPVSGPISLMVFGFPH